MGDSEKIVEDQELNRIMESGDRDELNELKTWLFKENIRLLAEKSELEQKTEELKKEREQFQREMEEVDRRLGLERKRLKQDEAFFDKKMDILKSGFAQLETDRMKLQKEKLRLEAEKSAHLSYSRQEKSMELAEMLFQGVKSQLALKKRYRDLIKMFHPDNIAGDHDMVLTVNKIYEELKRDYEVGKRA